MDIKITQAGLFGEIDAISSKSDVHRLLIVAALSDNGCNVITNCLSKDILATIGCLRTLGSQINITHSGGENRISVSTAIGATAPVLDCDESGSTARFLLPVAAGLCEKASFTGGGNLPNRPFTPLINQMKLHNCAFDSNNIPLTVTGKLGSGEYLLDGDISSQFISGLLFALPLQAGDSTVKINGTLQSRGYVNMTVDTLKRFGVQIQVFEHEFHIKGGQMYHSVPTIVAEGDWSNAAFWLCAGAISGGVTVQGLCENSLQKDSRIVKLLAEFGSKVSCKNGSVSVAKASLSGVDIDAGEIPDLVPVIAAVAAVSNGTTKIYNAKRLKFKESDRLYTTSTALRCIGADITSTDDALIINGKERLSGGVADSFNDHRIAMAVAIAASVCDNQVIITNANAVEKSYPDFFKDYNSLGGCAYVI